MGWTDERVELLKKLWADGLSASQIAAELGGITRNAVIGKVHRLGLSGRAKSPSSSAPRPRKARSSGHMTPQPVPQNRQGALFHFNSVKDRSVIRFCAATGTGIPPATAAIAAASSFRNSRRSTRF